MQRKYYLLFLLGFTLLVTVGVVVILQQDWGDNKRTPLETPAPVQLVDEEDAGVTISEDMSREAVAPDELEEDSSPGMPASYRRALGILKGRVVESDGTPVPDLKVEVYSFEFSDLFHDALDAMKDEPPQFELAEARCRTAEDGSFRFVDIHPRGLHALGVDLGGPRATSRIIDAIPNPGETVDLGDIVLRPHAVVVGKVVTDAGEPVKGARVRTTELPPVVFISGMQDYREGCTFLLRWSADHFVFELPPALKQLFYLMPFPTTTSQSDGTFRLEGVPLGLLSLVVDRPGYVTMQKPVSTARGGEKDVGDVTLDSGVVLEGKVVDHLGKPAPGAEVRVGPMYGITEMIVLQPSIRSEVEGKFVYPGAAPRSYFAAARRYPEDPWAVAGPFHPEFEPPVIELPPAYSLRLLVKRDDGKPAERLGLKLMSKQSIGDFMPFQNPIVPKGRMKIMDQGVIEVEHLARGKYDLLISAEDCGVTKETVSIGEDAVDMEVILEPAYTASIRVLLEKEKTPVEWAGVYAARQQDSWWFNPTKMSKSKSNAEGLAVLRNLKPGAYKVTVSHPAWAVTAATIEVPFEGEQVILLKPGGLLEGVVSQGNTEYEPPYMLAMQCEGGSEGPEFETPRLTVTDLEGRFRAKNLNPGTWVVTVLKRVLDKEPLGLSEVVRRGPLAESETEVWSGETSYLEIALGGEDLGPTGMVSGKVRVDGVPATGTLVSTYAKKRFEDTVDASGNYDLGRVPVGKHSLNIEQLPGRTGRYDSSIRRTIDVVEDETLFEDFEFLTGSISGQVVYDSDGSTVRGAKVSARIEEKDSPYQVRMSTVTDVDGRFFFDGVPIGSYTVKAEERKMGSQPVHGVKVFPGGKAGPVTLSMFAPIWVRGRLKVPPEMKDSRWVGLMIRPDVEGNQDMTWTRVDKDTGDFATDDLVSGYYTATLVGGEGTKSYKPMKFHVPPGGLSNLVFVPEREEGE